jgi:hypothetical protein
MAARRRSRGMWVAAMVAWWVRLDFQESVSLREGVRSVRWVYIGVLAFWCPIICGFWIKLVLDFYSLAEIFFLP